MELYHVLNRGVDRRLIFMDDGDRARFVHDLWEFNDSAPSINNFRWAGGRSENILPSEDYEPIVAIHGWCIMPNHYHLLLSELTEGGLTLFIRKLNVGYAKFFNEKYERQGTLLQGRTKRVLISREAHFLYILHYIHLNPLDLSPHERNWRDGSITNSANAITRLSKYRWSSYLDYIGKKNFPSVLSPELFQGVFTNYQQSIAKYLDTLDSPGIDLPKLE